MKNNIIYISSARLPTEKAHGLQIMKSCEAFSRQGARVDLVVPRRHNPIKEDPFTYYKVQKRFTLTALPVIDMLRVSFLPGWLAFYILSVSFAIPAIVYALIRNGRDTTIYCRDFIILFLLCLVGFRPVAELHDYKSEQPRWSMQFVLNRSSKVIVNSSGTLEKLQENYDINADNVMVIANGVDLAFFDIEESKEEVRAALNIPQERRIIAYVGRIETAGTDKGVGLLVEAFADIKDSIGDAMLYVVGGPDKRSEQLRKKALSLGIKPEAIRFVGFVPFREVPRYLRAIDAVVVPLPKGKHATITSPIKLFEFMAAGMLIIAPDFPSFREYLDDASAMFFSPDDRKDLATKMTFAISNDDTIEQKGVAAKKLAEQFTWAGRAKQIMRFIQSETA